MTNNLDITQLTESSDSKATLTNDATGDIDSALTASIEIEVHDSSPSVTEVPLAISSRAIELILVDGSPGPSGPFTVQLDAQARGLLYISNQTTFPASIEIDSQPGDVPVVGVGLEMLVIVDGVNVRAVAGGGGGGTGQFDNEVYVDKASAGGTAKIEYRTGGSGRARTGTLGNDDYTISVSPDGSVWVDAVVVDKDNGSVGLGIAPETDFQMRRTGGTAAFWLESEGDTAFRLVRITNNSFGGAFAFVKARGTFSAPANPNQNDTIGGVSYFGTPNYTAFWPAMQLLCTVIAATPSTTARDGRMVVNLGTGSSTTEFLRGEHATGLSMFGANIVIDQERNPRLRAYTVSTTPAHVAGKEIYLSDIQRGAISDGTNWVYLSGPTQHIVETGTTRNLSLADFDDLIVCSNASGCAYTILENSSVAIPIGGSITLLGTQNQVEFVQGSGVTLVTPASGSLVSAEAGALIMAIKTATNGWHITGWMAP